jgi:hypothetical protein
LAIGAAAREHFGVALQNIRAFGVSRGVEALVPSAYIWVRRLTQPPLQQENPNCPRN